MIDIKLIRENRALVKENIKKKFQDYKLHLVDEIHDLDIKWRKEKAQLDSLRAERNSISELINKEKKAGKDISLLLKKAKEIPNEIAKIEQYVDSLQKAITERLIQIPNIISDKTPIGKDASQNKLIKKWGKIPKFKFTPKNHVELLEKQNLADFDASAKVSGTGFYYLKNDLALLNQALIRFAIEFMRKKGYEYIEGPLMLNEKSIFASMDKKAIEQSVYSIKDEDLHLIGTSEQYLLAMHSERTFSEKELPKKYFSYSMCFRKEVGSHGINEKGLWRTHQFNKIEQFIFCKPEDSDKMYEELLKNSEEILKLLKLPYRVIEICSGDLSDWKYRSADLEVYRPTLKEYGEVGSLSNCSDYQARKLNIKFFNKNGERIIVHTLNNTGIATSRIMVAIIENYQQKDGTIKVPSALLKYLGKKIIGKPIK
ncbi:MAG: serine--tRNA ligase [Candidatus Pacearchaeota archaeon]|nr:serine--tRNA ligase [Candidatus Pacearchaeota archaeon]